MNVGPQQMPDRFHPRVETDLTVKVLVNGRAYAARARDLSMAGLFLECEAPSHQTRFTVALPLPDREVLTRCLVRRWEENGVGLEFEDLDWEDLFALARFLHPRLP
ncbi:MAG: PilZ domain-containing protein [Myxococcota bacterium]|nr:PilZ domain-containing protein [Myxococcota bacterium]